MTTDRKFPISVPPNVKTKIKLPDEHNFDPLTRSRSTKNIMKRYYDERALLAFGLITIFLSENRDAFFDRLRFFVENVPSKNVCLLKLNGNTLANL